jgi:hypothetical protein
VQGKTFVVPVGGLFKQTDKIMDKDGKSWFSPVGGIQVNSVDSEQAPRTDLLPKATMRLEFGKRAGDKLPGKIYLCIDDAEKTFVAGTFEAAVDESNGEKLTEAREPPAPAPTGDETNAQNNAAADQTAEAQAMSAIEQLGE